jgi:hypothetical protein
MPYQTKSKNGKGTYGHLLPSLGRMGIKVSRELLAI